MSIIENQPKPKINGEIYRAVLVTRPDDEQRVHIIEPLPISEPDKPERSKAEKAVRSIATGMLWGCAAGLIFAGGIAYERVSTPDHDTPTVTQVGSVLSDHNPPVWVDPDLGK
jgi:hypothetical protein